MDENEKIINLEEKKEMEKPKEIQVITGNGELMISPVYEHLEVEKPKLKDNRTIIVPEVKGNSPKKETEESSSENETDCLVDDETIKNEKDEQLQETVKKDD